MAIVASPDVIPDFQEQGFYPPSGEILPPLDRIEVLQLADDLTALNAKEGSFEASEAVQQLCSEIIETESDRVGYDLAESKDYVIVTRRGNGRQASLGRAIEARVFADRFKRTPQEVEEDYDPYDEASEFLICIDPKKNLPVGAIRITTNGPLGMPDFNVLALADEENNYEKNEDGSLRLDKNGQTQEVNPWYEELRQKYALAGEDLSEREIMQRAMFGAGLNDGAKTSSAVDVDSILDRTLNVATMSVLQMYSRGQSIPGPSTALYNGVLRTAKEKGAVFLAAIQDEVPYHLLNAFGAPFQELGLSHRPFGGPFDTIPSFCDLRTALMRMERDPDMGEAARYLIEEEKSQEDGYYVFPFEANGWWADKDEYGRPLPQQPSSNGHGNGSHNGSHSAGNPQLNGTATHN